MKLLNSEALADNLEIGVGEVDRYYGAISKEFRLRLPICGITSLAIANVLREMGHEVTVVKSEPRLAAAPYETHVFPVLHHDTHESTIIDATFGSFLRFTGLTAEGASLGQDNDYPKEKILTFDLGDEDVAARILAVKSIKTLQKWRPHPIYPSLLPVFAGLTTTEIYSSFAAFWKSENLREYKPTQHTVAASGYISGFIDPQNLELVNI